jgi:hypothetical protein
MFKFYLSLFIAILQSLILEKIDLLLRLSLAIIFKPSDTKLLVPSHKSNAVLIS